MSVPSVLSIVRSSIAEGQCFPVYCATRLQDADYIAAGASVVNGIEALGADVVLRVRPPALEDVDKMKEGAMWVWASILVGLAMTNAAIWSAFLF